MYLIVSLRDTIVPISVIGPVAYVQVGVEHGARLARELHALAVHTTPVLEIIKILN